MLAEFLKTLILEKAGAVGSLTNYFSKQLNCIVDYQNSLFQAIANTCIFT